METVILFLVTVAAVPAPAVFCVFANWKQEKKNDN